MDVPATVTSKGQITIPKSVRERLHLKTGDRVWF
ncbi:MAG: AbrB/MazE/SpoVT family DNA-binding domain-containing protein, partial [Actinomycetota bacterium]|nr:AbrB/MazE/SpoVT family DNA-binding domain-containing protein [Actinomycetota bacterium]